MDQLTEAHHTTVLNTRTHLKAAASILMSLRHGDGALEAQWEDVLATVEDLLTEDHRALEAVENYLSKREDRTHRTPEQGRR